MNNILITHISRQKLDLEQHLFCVNLRETNKLEFSFVPQMTFFVLGFRDILESIRIDQPSTALERSINLHCDEDSEHWRWFLDDLNTLGMDINYWGSSMHSILKTLWSPDTYQVRSLIYLIIHHIQASHTAEEKLIIIECLESAFAAFINSFNQLVMKSALYQDLIYFGKHHREQEAAHEMGSWIEGDKVIDQQHTDTDSIRNRYMLYVIDDIFAGFDKVFHCWNAAFTVEVSAVSSM